MNAATTIDETADAGHERLAALGWRVGISTSPGSGWSFFYDRAVLGWRAPEREQLS